MADKKFTREEIVNHNTKNNAVFIIDNVVYNVTKFLDDHPGGVEILLDNAGKDASKCFHDVGHTDEAKQIMKEYIIGEVVDEDKWEVVKKYNHWGGGVDDPLTLEGLFSVWLPPLTMGVLALIFYMYIFG